MSERPRDRVDIEGVADPAASEPPSKPKPVADEPRRFISVHHTCCNTYGRMYPDAGRTKFVGRCPKCGARVEATIGPGGTNRRLFDTQ